MLSAGIHGALYMYPRFLPYGGPFYFESRYSVGTAFMKEGGTRSRTPSY